MKAVLTYHSLDDSGSAISCRRQAFDRHVSWLTSGRVQVLTLEQLVAHPDESSDAVAVTFDDGFQNVREPVERLLDNGVPLTIFVASAHVGGTNNWGGRTEWSIPTLPLLGWDDLEALQHRGASVEAHTRRHPALTGLSGDELGDELGGCQQDLLARLGHLAKHLAYPYGDVDDIVAAHAAGVFQSCYTTEFRFLTSADPASRLPRLDGYYFQGRGAIEAWGSPAFQRRVRWCQLRRRVRARLLGATAARRVVHSSSAPQ